MKQKKRRFKEENPSRDHTEDHEELYALPSGISVFLSVNTVKVITAM